MWQKAEKPPYFDTGFWGLGWLSAEWVLKLIMFLFYVRKVQCEVDDLPAVKYLGGALVR